MSYRYAALGLELEAPFACPGFAPAAQLRTGREVRIELGEVPETLADPVCVRPLLQVDAAGTALFHVPGIARYRIERRSITIAVAPGVSRGRALDLLKGTPLALLCLQRGLMPLDAVAVARDGQALLLAGPAGCGKSSIAGALARHGFRLMADGLCALEAPEGAEPRIWPGFPELRLWPDSAAALHRSVAERTPSPGGRYILPADDWFDPAPRPLAAVATLLPALGGVAERVEREHGLAAFEATMELLRLPEAAAAISRRADWMQAAARAAAAAPSYTVRYRRDLAALDALAPWLLTQLGLDTVRDGAG